MAHIIALQGPARSGKTSTLTQVFKNLCAKYPAAIVQLLRSNTDIKVILHINGKIIGIESQGDPNSYLHQSLNDFVAAKCDIIFCACRTRGMTVGWVNAMSPQHNVQFITQTRVALGHTAANSAMATSLIQLAGL